jgi:predicted nucleotidyltransferase
MYAEQLPAVVRVLRAIAETLPTADERIVLVALFGSVARLSPHTASDTDVLVLLDVLGGAATREQVETALAHEWFALVRECSHRANGALLDWGVSTVTGDAEASDLDDDFVSIVGREGVLLYLRPGMEPPAALAHLTPFAVWAERVSALLDRCLSER